MFLFCSQDNPLWHSPLTSANRALNRFFDHRRFVLRHGRSTQKSKKIPKASRRVSASLGAGTDGRDEGRVSADRQRLHRSRQGRRIASRLSGQVAERRSQKPAGQADGKREPDREPVGFAPRSLIRGRRTSVLICHLTLLSRSQAKNACAPQHRHCDFPVCLGKVKFCKAALAQSIGADNESSRRAL
jgi:hypothetical protein